MIAVVPYRRAWYTLSGILIVASLIAMAVWRFNIGIDFTGGALVELEFSGARPDVGSIQRQVESLGAMRVKAQTAGDRSAIIRTAPLDAAVHRAITAAFADTATERRFESIGPSIGRELVRKTTIGLFLSLALITGYVAWVFRKAGREVSSWAYGLVALIAMAHDIFIPMGVFAILGASRGVEIDAPFIAALLTILGYSINDTIIVLDRIRENLTALRGKPFAEVVEVSVHQSFARSMNTTLTTLLALLAVVLLGGASVRWFAIALMIGIGVGAYSSIFIAAPLLVTWRERKHR